MADEQNPVRVSKNEKYRGKVVQFRNKKAHREVMSTHYSLDELFGFYNAMFHTYRDIYAQRSDAIVSPLRGSEPLVKSVKLVAGLEGHSSALPKVYYPKVGQVNYGKYSGGVIPHIGGDYAVTHNQVETEQKKEMNRIVEGVFRDAHYPKHPKKRILITVLDEVYSGGSISKNVQLLEEALQEVTTKRLKKGGKVPTVYIRVIAIANKNSYRCKEYRSLLSRGIVKEFVVPKLFTTDSPHFLYPLVKERASGKFQWLRREKPVKLALTRKSIDGRSTLFEDLASIHQLRKHWGVKDAQGFKHMAMHTQREVALLMLPRLQKRAYAGFARDIGRISRFKR